MEKKKVHIVVQDGLIQDVYVDAPLDVDIVIYDLDSCEDSAEFDKLAKEVDRLRSKPSPIPKVY